jgi:hypothetical protein
MHNLINKLKKILGAQNTPFGGGGGFEQSGGPVITNLPSIGGGSPSSNCRSDSTSYWINTAIKNAYDINRLIPDLHRDGYAPIFEAVISGIIQDEVSRLLNANRHCNFDFAFGFNDPMLSHFGQEADDVLEQIINDAIGSEAFINYKNSLLKHFANFNLTNYTSINSIGLPYLDCKKIKTLENATTSERVAVYGRIRDSGRSLPATPDVRIGSTENASDGIPLNQVFGYGFAISGIYSQSILEKIKNSPNFRFSSTPNGTTPVWVTNIANTVAAAYATSVFEQICAALGFMDLTQKRARLSKVYEECIMEEILGSNLSPEEKCALLNSGGNHPNNPLRGLGTRDIYARYFASCAEDKLAVICREPNYRNAGPLD